MPLGTRICGGLGPAIAARAMACLKVALDGALPGSVNMQRDSKLLDSHQPGDDPVLRLYRWRPASVTIGYNQDFGNFDREAIEAFGCNLVKRPTGGRAIFHADELTYSVTGSSPGPLFGNNLHQSYMKINEALILFLQRLGLEAEISAGETREAMRSLVCFKSAGKHEIRVGGKKLVGSAQRRRGGVFLQHGSILTGDRHLQLPGFLRPGPAGTGMSQEELANLTTDLSRELGESFNEERLRGLEKELASCFSETLQLDILWVGAGESGGE